MIGELILVPATELVPAPLFRTAAKISAMPRAGRVNTLPTKGSLN